MRVSLISAPSLGLSGLSIKPYPYPPLGLLAIAAGVQRSTAEVLITDIGQLIHSKDLRFDKHFEEAVAEFVSNRQPDLVGLSTMCNSYAQSIEIAREIKKRRRSTTIVLGGPQATATDLDTLNAFECIDFVVTGEADHSFGELLLRLKGPAATDRMLMGVTYRDQKGVPVRAHTSPTLETLDDLPFPDFSSIQYYGCTALHVEAGRGCPYSCKFCSTSSFFGRRFRLKSPERIVREALSALQFAPTSKVMLVHDLFTANRSKVVDFCTHMESAGVPFHWSCSSRVDTVDDELLKRMARAGCWRIFFGVESGSSRTQLEINKRLNTDLIQKTLASCVSLEVSPTASFIVGFPTESATDLIATLTSGLKLFRCGVKDIHVHLLSPLPGAKLTAEYAGKLQRLVFSSDFSWNFGRRTQRAYVRDFPAIFSSFYCFPQKAWIRVLAVCTILILSGLSILSNIIPLLARSHRGRRGE